MPIDELGLVERLKADVSQILKMQEQARFAGDHTYIRVANPEYLMSDLKQAAAAIERLLAERDEAREALRPFAEGSIDVSGTAVIGVTRHDLARARQALEDKP